MKHIETWAILVIAALFSLNSCSDNYDINKEGGVRIVVEVSPTDFLKSLSGGWHGQDFNTALELAENKRRETDGDFFTLFEETLQEISPENKLAPLFLFNLKEYLNMNSSNDEVLEVLRSEYEKATDRSQMIIKARLEQLPGLKRFNVKSMETPGRILIELASNNSLEIARIEKLIGNEGNLEFWETYNLDEIRSCLDQANTAIAQSEYADSETPENPLFALLPKDPLFVHLDDSSHGNSACIGLALVKDTADINRMLLETKDLFPLNFKPAWTVHPKNHGDHEYLELVALKASRDNRCAMDGSTIIDAEQTFNPDETVEVTLQMNREGANAWRHFTHDNIGKQIAIVLDNYVYSYPVVNDEIPNGRSSISGGNMTIEEAKDLANILKTGKHPLYVRIIEETVVEPEKDR